MATIEIVLKHVKDRDQQAALDFLRAHKTLKAVIYSHEISTAFSLYIAHYAGNPEFFMELAEHVHSPYKEDMVSIAQQLEERGIQREAQ